MTIPPCNNLIWSASGWKYKCVLATMRISLGLSIDSRNVALDIVDLSNNRSVSGALSLILAQIDFRHSSVFNALANSMLSSPKNLKMLKHIIY